MYFKGEMGPLLIGLYAQNKINRELTTQKRYSIDGMLCVVPNEQTTRPVRYSIDCNKST